MSALYENPESYDLSFAVEIGQPDPVFAAVGMTVLYFNTLRQIIQVAVSRLAPSAGFADDVHALDFEAQVRTLSAAIWMLEFSNEFRTTGRSEAATWEVLSTQCERAFAKFERVSSLNSVALCEMAMSLNDTTPGGDRSEIVASKILDDIYYIHTLMRHLNDFFGLDQ